MIGPLLRCRELRVRRDNGFVLELASLELEPGSVTALMGPNGSGKSTLLLSCAGLCDLERGRVALDASRFHEGRAPASTALRQDVVLVPQDPYLMRGTVLRNLGLGLRLRHLPRDVPL